ncbi:hypothetical protein L3V79_07530 [Thiotrichales bacterium 19S9-12]|nr:hypothetical protein [Thiotrichales bacterium 19S9-11]MCF6812203.1 hypothetical protein [Thiotrichales bacterium 19S9-12]
MDTTVIYNHYMSFKAIENDLLSLLRYVDLNENNYCTTSAEIRKVLLISCQMVEIIGKGILDSECDNLPVKDRVSFPEYFMNTLKVRCSNDISVVTPRIYNEFFKPWYTDKINSWWGAYNNIKHNNLKGGTFINCLYAICAFYSLIVYITRKSSINYFWHRSDLIQVYGNINDKIIKAQSIHNAPSKQVYKWFRWDEHL